MLASPFLHPENDPPKEENFPMEISGSPKDTSCSSMDLDESESFFKDGSEEYVQLQRRIYLATISFSAIAVGITALFFDLQTTISLLLGALFGLLYLRLLARSIGKLGKSTKQVGKIQLIVPVLLVLAAGRLPQLDLIPALLGFLLYKPSLIFQMLLES